MREPLISVIIPAHDSAGTIGTAIESILNQTWKNLEVIVADDNSKDSTKEVVLSYIKRDSRVSYHALTVDDPHRVNRRGRNINAGYMARNFAFEFVKGEYVTFQDADDASFKNRIAFQYDLLIKHNATHVTLDWQMYDERYLGKSFDGERFLKDTPGMVGPDELYALSQKTKGIFHKAFGNLHTKIDFELKRARVINKFFFGSLASYPGTGNSPLFKREVIDKVKFRKLADRIWPSFMGRGADRDWNFQVAETYKNSYVFFVPMYLWRQNKQNEKYNGNLNSYITN